MMLHNDISLLVEGIRQKAIDAISAMRNDELLRSMGVSGVVINETLRDLSTQMAYFSRGRMPPPDAQAMYTAAGLYKMSAEEARTPITWTLDSKHLRGEAVDIVPMRAGIVWWNAPKDVWDRMGKIGEDYGLSWGGRWKKPDTPHFEI